MLKCVNFRFGDLFIKISVGDIASYKVAFEFEIRALTN
jgi:hypothetical protein